MTKKRALEKKIKSLQEMREAVLKEMKKSYTRSAILELIDSEISKFSNPNDYSYVIRTNDKNKVLRFFKGN